MSAERRTRTPWRLPAWTAFAVVLVTAAVLLASVVVDGASPLGPVTVTPRPTLAPAQDAACGRWYIVAGRGQERGAAASLFSDGLAVVQPCDDTAHEVTLEGSSVRGVGAFAVVSDAAGVRFAGFVDGTALVRVQGDVRLAFTNDLATADEDRNLHATLR